MSACALQVAGPLKTFIYFAAYACPQLYTRHSRHVEVRGQLCAVSALLPPCQSQGPNSDQVWQVSLPGEPF